MSMQKSKRRFAPFALAGEDMTSYRRPRKPAARMLAVVAALGLIPQAIAWDGEVTGTVSGYEIVALENGGHNYDFRVHLSGVGTMCTGGAGSWAYINTDAGNYKAIVGAVIAAHQTGKQITIWTNRGAQNYCQIGHVMAR